MCHCEVNKVLLQEILVDRAVHAAMGRFVSRGMAFGSDKIPTLTKDDFLQAMKEFLPIAMRDITKSATEEGHGGWQDVGGLTEIRNSIKEVQLYFSLSCLSMFNHNLNLSSVKH